MSFSRFPLRDPRTLARDIPGFLDAIFPQLNAALVSHFNRQTIPFPQIAPLSEEAIEASNLNGAMLFELAVVRAEQMLNGSDVANWDECLAVASARQRRHFDAEIPSKIEPHDIEIAQSAASNLVNMLSNILASNPECGLQIAPHLRGYSWISSGNADFAVGPILLEVKFQTRNFSVADFRQVLMYWFLSYASSVEKQGVEFLDCILLNPRKNRALAFKFSNLTLYAASGMGKVEIMQHFDAMLADPPLKIQNVI